MLRSIALLALVAGASAYIEKPKCPMVPGMFPFDLEKFGGDWHLAAGNDVTIEKKGKCGKVTFPVLSKEERKAGLIINSRYAGVSVKDNKPIAYQAYFQPIISDHMANMYGVFRAENSNVYSPIYKNTVVAADYSNYAVLLSCKTHFDGEAKTFGRTLMAEIWTRPGVNLSKDTLHALTTVLASYDVDPESIKPIETKC